jgi:hypothetical protein
MDGNPSVLDQGGAAPLLISGYSREADQRSPQLKGAAGRVNASIFLHFWNGCGVSDHVVRAGSRPGLRLELSALSCQKVAVHTCHFADVGIRTDNVRSKGKSRYRSVTQDNNPASTEESRFRGALDDVIIIPLVLVALASNTIMRFILSILMRLLDYAFPLAMQIVLLPLFAARVLGNVIVTVLSGALRFLPLSEKRRREWKMSIRRNWSWLRRKISYRAFEHVVRVAFEGGMAWVFRKCRHLTPNTALLVILGAVLWLPISFGVATAIHAVLFAKLTSWPAWVQLFHPLATVIAKSKLLVLPVYPAAWPQAKKTSFVQFVVKGYEDINRLYVIKKVGFRYRRAKTAGNAVLERLRHTRCLASVARWLRNAHVAEHLGVEKPTEKLRSFFLRWSIKFSAEYYEAQEPQD